MRSTPRLIPFVALLLAACGDAVPPATDGTAVASAPAPAAGADAELEQVKALVPIDACALLAPEKLLRGWPDLRFELRQRLEPRLSGYAWDSRCTWWAGVGTIGFAKDTPTHTVEIFVATPATAAKARERLASRRETAAASSGFQTVPELGQDAYAIARTGVASVFFVRGGSEVQLNVSDLDTPDAEKVRKAVALVQSL